LLAIGSFDVFLENTKGATLAVYSEIARRWQAGRKEESTAKR
jgi:hypothetical protein